MQDYSQQNGQESHTGTGQPLMPEDEHTPEAPLNMPDSNGAGVMDFADASAAGKRSIPGGPMLVLLILGLGGLTLWAMQLGAGSPVKDEGLVAAELKIDQVLKNLALASSRKNSTEVDRDSVETLFRDADQVVALFANDPVKNQVRLEDLAKNPFELPAPKPAVKDIAVPVASTDRQKEEMRKKLADEAGKMKLQSVLRGATPLAILNGNVVRVGESVGSFVVVAIDEGGVHLTAEGDTFVVTMPLPQAVSKTANK